LTSGVGRDVILIRLKKNVFRLFLILLISLSQIPVLPIVALLFAYWDRGHEVYIEEKQGVLTFTLRHGEVRHAHSKALDVLIQVTGHAHEDLDHKLSFTRCKVLGEEFRGHFDTGVEACFIDILQEDLACFTVATQAVDHSAIHYDRYHRISAIPRGLRQTVLLV
jgi:hypothetical protein